MSKRKLNYAAKGSSERAKKHHTDTGHYWKDGLKRAMENPSLVVKSDKYTVTIRDKFPKARYHFLIIPKNEVSEIADVQSLNRSHIQLLEHMQREAFSIIASNANGMSSDFFNIGYHAIPSMSPFHLHVISKDFDSPYLKTKKHWNSFTTDFFRRSSDVLEELERNGKVQIEKSSFESLLKSELRCHWCSQTQKNIPALKLHIKSCSQRK